MPAAAVIIQLSCLKTSTNSGTHSVPIDEMPWMKNACVSGSNSHRWAIFSVRVLDGNLAVAEREDIHHAGFNPQAVGLGTFERAFRDAARALHKVLSIQPGRIGEKLARPFENPRGRLRDR